jgi:hypothetical protein
VDKEQCGSWWTQFAVPNKERPVFNLKDTFLHRRFFKAERLPDASTEPDIEPLVDLTFVFRAEDGESAHFRGTAHMGSPTRLRVEALDLDNADSAV